MNTRRTALAARSATIRTGAGVTLALLLCGAVQAQSVYKCRVDGRTVFQSSPCAVQAQAHAAAPAAPAPVAANNVDANAVPKKKSLADLLRERDGADRNRSTVREAQGDGATVLRARMGAV